MPHALFDILRGRYSDGTPLGEAHASESTMRSVCDHLERLLNAHAGALAHLPDYGLPDLPTVYQNLPYSLGELALVIQQVVQRYEPRLAQVQLDGLEAEQGEDGSVMAMEITGVLPDGNVGRFRCSFFGSGQVRVREAWLGAHYA